MSNYMVASHPHPHMASAAPPPPVHPPWCETCRKSFADMPQYIDHLKSHIANQIGLFDCSSCHGVCRNPEHLKAIIRSGPSQHIPPPLNPEAARMVSVELREADAPKKPSTPAKTSKKKSRRIPQELPRPFACDMCDKTFTKDTYLIQHRRIHTGERPFVCDVCNKTFTQSGHLVNHKRVHIGDRPFSCEICNKGFAHSRNLIRHRRAHTGERPYACDLCGKSFLQSEHLSNHKRRIHEGMKLSCAECGKHFSHSFNLERHSRIHTGERPFQCSHCDKSFNQSTHLTNHLKCHEKPDGNSSSGDGGGGPTGAAKSDERGGVVERQREDGAVSTANDRSIVQHGAAGNLGTSASSNPHPLNQHGVPVPVPVPVHHSTPTMHPNSLLPRPPEAGNCVFPPGFPWYRAPAHTS